MPWAVASPQHHTSALMRAHIVPPRAARCPGVTHAPLQSRMPAPQGIPKGAHAPEDDDAEDEAAEVEAAEAELVAPAMLDEDADALSTIADADDAALEAAALPDDEDDDPAADDDDDDADAAEDEDASAEEDELAIPDDDGEELVADTDDVAAADDDDACFSGPPSNRTHRPSMHVNPARHSSS